MSARGHVAGAEESWIDGEPREVHAEERGNSVPGFQVGKGQIHPLGNKMEALKTYPWPAMKKQD